MAKLKNDNCNISFPVLNITFDLNATADLIKDRSTRINLVLKKDMAVNEMINLFCERFDKNTQNIIKKEMNFFFLNHKLDVNSHQKISELFKIENHYQLDHRIIVHQRGIGIP